MKGKKGILRFSILLVAALAVILIPANLASANTLPQSAAVSADTSQVMAGSAIGIVSSEPISTGTADEYNLFLTINGEQVWVAASTTDYPELFNMGAMLSGTLDYSSGWWTFKKAGSLTPTSPVPVQVSGFVATIPTPTGTPNEYSFLLTLYGGQVWVSATTTDFPQLLAIGASLGGYLDYSSGSAVFKRVGSITPTPPVTARVYGNVASIPTPTGTPDEYNLFLMVNGQQVWVAASTTDYPNLFNMGATLSGVLDYSSGWWTFKLN